MSQDNNPSCSAAMDDVKNKKKKKHQLANKRSAGTQPAAMVGEMVWSTSQPCKIE
jgi:hypothetical protein